MLKQVLALSIAFFERDKMAADTAREPLRRLSASVIRSSETRKSPLFNERGAFGWGPLRGADLVR